MALRARDRQPMIRVDHTGAVAVITVGSGARRNALLSNQWVVLADAVHAIAARDDVAVVLIRGAGNTFCAGSDIREWWGAPEEFVERSFTAMESAFRAVETCPIPVVAQISGVAAGAGCQLALACDIRIIADDGCIGMPIARLGINASPAFAERLIRAAGPAVSARLLYQGLMVCGSDAVRTGLANECVEDSRIEQVTAALIDDISRQPVTAVRAAKAAIRSAMARVVAPSCGPVVHYSSLQRGIGTVLKPTSV